MDTVVIKGLIPDTSYQFAVRAVNAHGSSPRSLPSDTVRTLSEYLGPAGGPVKKLQLIFAPKEAEGLHGVYSCSDDSSQGWSCPPAFPVLGK